MLSVTKNTHYEEIYLIDKHEAEEELKALKQERKDLDTLFYGKDNPEENS